ncbi:MAG: AGE family epimerase/isomerase [Candidatus Promineifilaceae bacterium]|nr:AGE family epimerase/isomerase [Candidatus Promineifilaceae bacterium]
MRLRVRFSDLLAIYRAELLERTIPFWMTHALDREHGGILTCVSDEGYVLSTDKYLWSQLRAIWTFSALYNKIERRPEWLDAAWHIYDFVKQYGRIEDGRWVFAVTASGEILEGPTSIYADGFAIYGLTELARATGEKEVIDLALQTYQNVQRLLDNPGSYATAPYPLPEGVKAHGVSMIFSLVFHELGQFLADPTILGAALKHAEEVMTAFLRPEDGLVYEFVTLDNELLESPQGRAVVPGHAIESMWFMIHIYQHWNRQSRIDQAVSVIKRHITYGWDERYGGILLSRDAAGGEPWWPFADSKLWWPHTEALYALLLAYEQSADDWALEWFSKVHDYAFDHYPVPRYGEWTQKLDRQGREMKETIALPVKDPFHLPRALIYCADVLQRLSGDFLHVDIGHLSQTEHARNTQ